jgi:hypothetical protein
VELVHYVELTYKIVLIQNVKKEEVELVYAVNISAIV